MQGITADRMGAGRKPGLRAGTAQGADAMSPGEQLFDKAATDVPGTAGHEDVPRRGRWSHGARMPPQPRARNSAAVCARLDHGASLLTGSRLPRPPVPRHRHLCEDCEGGLGRTAATEIQPDRTVQPGEVCRGESFIEQALPPCRLGLP